LAEKQQSFQRSLESTKANYEEIIRIDKQQSGAEKALLEQRFQQNIEEKVQYQNEYGVI
jgi:hypothetical protein